MAENENLELLRSIPAAENHDELQHMSDNVVKG
jgi:hypothetical protein